ncbi:MAG: YbaB/EbfC family nucleoid-associated protein [Planctomycetia bacterium]|nr:YbaB/EbfC family nucleoid-associated protein [Planctomycetia bacterium]
MFKGLGQFASLMKNAQEIQGRMKEMQEALKRLKVEGTAGGGMVAVEMNGQQQVLSCRIEPALFESRDREMVEDLVVAAVNQALDKVKQAAAEEMGKLTGGLDMPGIGDALSKLGLGNGAGS